MPVDYKDYYKILGVPKTSDAATIKKAFRKLAREFHPDVAKNKAVAEERFKEINEANEVLGDPDKRRQYDELGADWNQPPRPSATSANGFADGAADGAGFHFEGTGFSDFFEQIFGRQHQPGGGFARAQNGGDEDGVSARRGQDVESDLLVTLDEVLHGSTRTIRLQRTDPRHAQLSPQQFRVRIPPGVREAQLIRVTGKGREGIGGGEAGNLYLRVTYAQHPDFRVRGANLYHDLELAPWEAVLGTTVPVPTLDGAVSVKIPPGTVAGQEFRLRGKGLPTGDGARGDLHAVVSLALPSEVTPEQKAVWEQLAAVSPFNPRKSA